jgi:hypothetical protein
VDKTVLEIPEELKGMVPALRGVLDAVMTQVERGRRGGPAEYAAFQSLMVEKLGEVERRADEAALAALDVDLPKVLINKVLHTRVLRCPTTFKGLGGDAQVTRSLYRPCGVRNAPVVDVVALRAGAIAGVWLPATAREMAFEVQQVTSREAEMRSRCTSPVLPPRAVGAHILGHDGNETDGRDVGEAGEGLARERRDGRCVRARQGIRRLDAALVVESARASRGAAILAVGAQGSWCTDRSGGGGRGGSRAHPGEGGVRQEGAG